MDRYVKIYVAVTLFVSETGKVKPLSLFFDGREYFIDRVTDARLAPPQHVGGLITKRYDCLISGHERKLYSESTGRWFLEVKIE